MIPFGEYCSFTKTVEHLGDRWSLLIIRELARRAPLGFNAFASDLPGISRSVLARRLRKLEVLGLIARDPSVGGRQAPYRLAPAGEQLIPTLLSLKDWAERWVPEDPAMAERDPSVITWWLRHRVDAQTLPDHQVVISLDIGGQRPEQVWLVLERAAEPSLCLEDPRLAQDRYVYVEAGAAALYPISRGERSWEAAIADRSIQLYGEPTLVRALPSWFMAADAPAPPAEAPPNGPTRGLMRPGRATQRSIRSDPRAERPLRYLTRRPAGPVVRPASSPTGEQPAARPAAIRSSA